MKIETVGREGSNGAVFMDSKDEDVERIGLIPELSASEYDRSPLYMIA